MGNCFTKPEKGEIIKEKEIDEEMFSKIWEKIKNKGLNLSKFTCNIIFSFFF